MKDRKPYVAVDWGTSRLRAYLCRGADASRAMLEGPGIAQLRDTAARTLLGLIAPWEAEFGRMDLLLCGMAGSNAGWRAVPYLACPLDPHALAGSLLRFEDAGHQVSIVPGLSCTNRLGQPDVMRGEEVQVLGWLERHGGGSGQLLCLPGTHTKWVQLRDGRIESFTTSITGELYALLRDRSVLLATGSVSSRELDGVAFDAGVLAALQQGEKLSQLLFSTRARALLDPENSGDAASYLSGLLIGADIQMAIGGNSSGSKPIVLVGAPALCRNFVRAMKSFGVDGRIVDGDEMSIAGLTRISELAT